MTPESILCEAIEVADPTDRAAFLDRICEGDPALRARLGQLAEDHFRAGSFLDGPPAAFAPDETVSFVQRECEAALGTRIGPFTLLELLGEGGMGVVYVADQSAPVKRRVALKVIKPGMDSRQVVARFEAERQALALMDHPNIARILDGGTTDAGRPFFVMELVRGIPITDYCDQAGFTTRQRLELFAQVCAAVQHAHQKGVIHRDIKPSNVMVTLYDGVPVPKVIDFGIAKAVGQSLSERTVYTRLAQMVGTPLYMSPEQAELSALDVDTRSDVYSLGVLLYELLAGTTPFDAERFRSAGFDEVRRIIREDEPPRPSERLSTLSAEARTTVSGKRGVDGRRLAGELRGELDWIVMRCLEKDRNRRYDTTSALVADLQHYLAHEPVTARPQSRRYRLRKFARRNRAALAAAAVVLFVVLPALSASTLLFWDQKLHAEAAQREAEDEKQRAQEAYQEEARHRNRARQAVNTMYTEVAERLLPKEPGLGGIRKEFLLKALAFYEEEAAATPDDAESRVQLTLACRRAARIYWANGDNTSAIRLYDRTVELATGLVADNPADPERRALLAHAYFERSFVLTPTRGIPEAKTDRLRSLESYSRLAAERPQVFEYRKCEAGVCVAMGDLAADNIDSERYFRRGMLLLDALAGDFPKHDIRLDTAHATMGLGVCLSRRATDPQAREEADKLLNRALPIRRSLVEGANFHPEHLFQLGLTLVHLAEIQDSDFKGHTLATQYFEEAKAAFLRLDRDHAGHTFNGHRELILALGQCGRKAEVAAYVKEVARLHAGDARAHERMGQDLFDAGLREEALSSFREAIRLKPDDAISHYKLGCTYHILFRLEEAIPCFRVAIKLQPDLADAHVMLGRVLLLLGRFEESLAELRRGHELGSKLSSAMVIQAAEKEFAARIETLQKFVAGATKPSVDAKEMITLAEIAYHRKWYACSAELFADAFQLNPKLDHWQNFQDGRYRTLKFKATCAAAQAGFGRGEDAAKLNEADCRRRRRQAISWLTADLAALSEQPTNPRVLERWHLDPEFSPLRDEAELKKLPDTEQAELRKLWADLDALQNHFDRQLNPRLAPLPRPKRS